MIAPGLNTPQPLATGQFFTNPSHSNKKIPNPLPLPGVVIFVHGVNSDGEWFDASEEGLCKGLNKRLARQSEQLACQGPVAGQLREVKYSNELTSAGFINPDRSAKNFIDTEAPHWSPVIRFRWGYKASKDDLKLYGSNIWLNEQDYWGGGPFANGCTSLPDLWSEGTNDRLFLWLTAQHVNPVPGRDVFACPPRSYYVFAALRLAKLVASIRAKQADCPVTIVCHSQGNMVGIAAAFLGERLGDAVADNYILCNPPLSLRRDNLAEQWTQRYTISTANQTSGRQTSAARNATLAHYFGILHARASKEQDAASIDKAMANENCPVGTPYKAGTDRKTHGFKERTYGRVTLYCCPHDQVISATPVQGIGWLGMHADEIEACNGKDVFSQRVFAQGYPVGAPPGKSSAYHYLNDRWNKDRKDGKDGFWHPPSPTARFSLRHGLDANTSLLGKTMTVATCWLLSAVDLFKLPVNATPEENWVIPINAPPLPEPFTPKARRFGQVSEQFDEGYDPGGNSRNAQKPKAEKAADDPYDSHTTLKTKDGSMEDRPMGDANSEAQMRYEDRARLRMRARREGLADENNRVVGEDDPTQASEAHKQWRNAKIKTFLSESVDQNATDHSTIVTNPMHAEKAMAYDVAIGVCRLNEADWRELRVEADWRYLQELRNKKRPNGRFAEYFNTGKMTNKDIHSWANSTPEARMPPTITDERTVTTYGYPRQV
ncbi:MAG: DUF3274 domain-containing protein [Proteobacteria bacterium]|nr:DUF3274 domain-containing protein [Pseudomonadota bacterium]